MKQELVIYALIEVGIGKVTCGENYLKLYCSHIWKYINLRLVSTKTLQNGLCNFGTD